MHTDMMETLTEQLARHKGISPDLCSQYDTMVFRAAEIRDYLACRYEWYKAMSRPRRDAIVNIAYEYGIDAFLDKSELIESLMACDYLSAADAIMDLSYDGMEPQRVAELATQMQYGERSR